MHGGLTGGPQLYIIVCRVEKFNTKDVFKKGLWQIIFSQKMGLWPEKTQHLQVGLWHPTKKNLTNMVGRDIVDGDMLRC